VNQPAAKLFRPNAFPVIVGQVVISDNGRAIARAEKAPRFRLLAIIAKTGPRSARLFLR